MTLNPQNSYDGSCKYSKLPKNRYVNRGKLWPLRPYDLGLRSKPVCIVILTILTNKTEISDESNKSGVRYPPKRKKKK